MRKRSNIILAIIFLSASVGLGIYANHIRSTTEQRPARVSRAVEIEEGERFSRESNVSYKHLHTENNKSGTVIGNIQLSVQDTLLAKLYGTMNVLFQGATRSYQVRTLKLTG